MELLEIEVFNNKEERSVQMCRPSFIIVEIVMIKLSIKMS